MTVLYEGTPVTVLGIYTDLDGEIYYVVESYLFTYDPDGYYDSTTEWFVPVETLPQFCYIPAALCTPTVEVL